jgi:hypothetical protein
VHDAARNGPADLRRFIAVIRDRIPNHGGHSR